MPKCANKVTGFYCGCHSNVTINLQFEKIGTKIEMQNYANEIASCNH